MTAAAERFVSEVTQSWDSLGPWEDTAELGLSEVDEDTLRSYCSETGEDFGAACRDVRRHVGAKLGRLRESAD